MKILHLYDHTYYKKGDAIYSNGAFNSQSWERYLEHFEELTVCGNLSNRKDLDFSNMNLVDRPKVGFHFLPNHRELLPYLKSSFTENSELLHVIESHDAIIIRLPSEIGFFGQYIAERLRKPYALEVVGCPWDAYWNHGRWAGKLLAVISYFKMKRALRGAKFAIYVTRYFLQNRYPTSGYYSAASNVMLPRDHQARLKDRYERPPSRRLKLGIIGSLAVRYKGHNEAIRALALVKSEIPDFQLDIVGPGDSDWIRKLAKTQGLNENVNILGKLKSGSKVYEYLDDLDLYLHPSKQEGLPRSVIEAMSRGCPILASSIAGIPELIESKYLHAPGNYRRLAQQIKSILGDPEERKRMSATNIERAKGYYPDLLEEKRYDFFRKFREYVDTQMR